MTYPEKFICLNYRFAAPPGLTCVLIVPVAPMPAPNPCLPIGQSLKFPKSTEIENQLVSIGCLWLAWSPIYKIVLNIILYIQSKVRGRLAKFCGILRIYEL